jgi:hypothetical protein
LYDAIAQLIRANDNWQEAPNRQQIIDSTIPPPNEFESAMLRDLEPGAYTAVIPATAISSMTDDSGNVFWPDVSFTYQCKESSSRHAASIAFGRRGYSSRAGAEEFQNQLLTDASSLVRYDPAEPSFAFLRNGPLAAIMLPLVLGAVFLVVGAVAHQF